MGVLVRILRLFKADMHGVMDELEDKGLLLRQYLREMEEDLRQKEARLEQMAGTCRGIEKDLALCVQELGKMGKDLDLAVSRGKDEIARMLIRKRRTLIGSRDHLQRQLDTLSEEKDKIAGVLEEHRLQYERFKIEAMAYCRNDRKGPHREPLDDTHAFFVWQTPSEEEVEMELLRRKEAAGKGGAA